MNIFFLSRDPVEAARLHCDRHVMKMLLETAQLLSTAHAVRDTWRVAMYRPTHQNHPVAVWVQASHQHYLWALTLFRALCAEYTYRWDKVHKSESLMPVLQFITGPDEPWMDPPRCVQNDDPPADPVEAYRAYYRSHKRAFATWRRRPIPEWMND